MIHFPVSGIDTFWWFPPLVAFLISMVTATGGVSGAFLLLPFQVSVLGFTSPGVSPTNLIFNIIGIPSGVYRYNREKRMVWPLAWSIVIGIIPGMFLGAVIRVNYLTDPEQFKPFAGLVLIVIALKLLKDISSRSAGKEKPINVRGFLKVSNTQFSYKRIGFTFNSKEYRVSLCAITVPSFVVGIAGGAYGIGGGAIMAPFLVSVLNLPVYTVAGAALFSTFVGSIGGVLSYWLLDVLAHSQSSPASPDWLLGISMGLGGVAGMYVGARIQRYVPARLIKVLLTVSLFSIAARYISSAFF